MKAIRRSKNVSINHLKIMADNLAEVTQRPSCVQTQSSSWARESYQIYIASSSPDKEDYIIKDVKTWKECQDLYLSIMKEFGCKGGLYG
jgi:hypothetical protein